MIRKLKAAAASLAVVAAVAGSAAFAPLHASSVTDVAPGTSLSSVHVTAGNTYDFKGGATYTGGPLKVNAANVTIGQYGTGAYPIFKRTTEGDDIDVSANQDTVQNIHVEGQGYSGTNGYEIGIDVTGTSDTLEADKACGSAAGNGDLYAGVYLETAASSADVDHLVVLHCDALNPSNLGSGAFGVLVWGSNNTVNNSSFTDDWTSSPDFGTDGSGVEIYNGSHNLIENSSGTDDVDFTELGTDGSHGTVTGNTFTSDTFGDGSDADGGNEFLVTRGSGDTSDGPVFGTTMNSDTITLNDAGDEGVVSYDWKSGDGTLLTLNSNTVDVPNGTALTTDGGCVTNGLNNSEGNWNCQS